MSKTKVLKVDPLLPQENDLVIVADIIKSGGLAILPTETVYGIAADISNKKALEKLYEVKKRPKDKPFSLLISRIEDMQSQAINISPAAYRLAYKFWPGPLTLILQGKNATTVGLRMPDHRVALEIVNLVGYPLACPSANLSGKPPATNFQQALADFQGLVEVAVDAGPVKIGLESSIVDVSIHPHALIREGAIKKEALEEAVKRKIVLFVCTGNSCRSVIAQALLAKKLDEKHRSDIQVLSAGISVIPGMGATDAAREILRRENINVSNHHAQKITLKMIHQADFVLVMEHLHEQRVLEICPDAKNKVFLLKEFAKINDNNLDILDPIGMSLDFYQDTLSVIQEAIERVAEII